MLQPVTTDVWIEERGLRFLGLETGTRMTVVRLANGGLFVHSPVALDEPTRGAVDALGPVKAVVAPCLFHHLYVGEWARAYPGAVVAACPGLPEKRKDVTFATVLADEPHPEWKSELDQVSFGACPIMNEVVFFHRKSKTVICSDFIFNLATHPSWFTRTVGRVIGTKEPGVTLLERLTIRDREAAREQVGRVVAWGSERIVLAHGDIVSSNGADVIRRAYEWLS